MLNHFFLNSGTWVHSTKFRRGVEDEAGQTNWWEKSTTQQTEWIQVSSSQFFTCSTSLHTCKQYSKVWLQQRDEKRLWFRVVFASSIMVSYSQDQVFWGNTCMTWTSCRTSWSTWSTRYVYWWPAWRGLQHSQDSSRGRTSDMDTYPQQMSNLSSPSTQLWKDSEVCAWRTRSKLVCQHSFMLFLLGK